MTLYGIYYIEINIICILLAVFILITYVKEMRGIAEARFYKAEIIEFILYCVSDIIAALLRGSTFPGARAILYVTNAVYVSLPLLMAITWGLYINAYLIKFNFKKSKADLILQIFSSIVILCALSSPATHFAFYLDAENLYHRCIGSYVIPFCSYLYLLYISIKLLVISKKIESFDGKIAVRTFSILAIPCILFSIPQVLIYGCTSTQVGFMIGFLIIYIMNQQNKISKDELTRLNNRREFEAQFENISKNAERIFVGMVDVDNFKSINDTFGHSEGDQALKRIAMALAKSCDKCKGYGNFILARYGGDEFIFFAKDFQESAKEKLLEAINSEIENINRVANVSYTLALSVGIAYGSIQEKKDAVTILKTADDEMYKIKKEKGSLR